MDNIQQLGAGGVNTSFSGNEYFTARNNPSSFLGINSTPYTSLTPRFGVVDVWRDMYWSNSGNKDEVPQIFVVEKELQYGTWATQLANVLTQLNNGISNQTIDSFVQLYKANDTGFSYNFPWLLKGGDNIRSISNDWARTEGLGDFLGSMGGKGGGGGDLIGAAAGAVLGAITPGFGFEDTKAYGGTNEQELTISFPLYNTKDLQSAFKHFSFVNLFTFQNLKTRTSLMTFIPPKIYTVDSYATGGIYMAAAYVSNFSVASIGTTRAMSDWYQFGPTNIIMPEAYKVTITFKDLLSQSSNVFAGAMGGVKVTITNAESPVKSFKNFFSPIPAPPPNP
jgi:hypothetical protein